MRSVRPYSHPGRALLENLLLDLLDDLVDPNLNLFLLFFFCGLFVLEALVSALPALLGELFLRPESPSVPLIDETLPLSNEFGTDVAFLRSILFVELPAVLFEVPTDLPLLLLGEQRAGTRPPEELLEPVEDVLL